MVFYFVSVDFFVCSLFSYFDRKGRKALFLWILKSMLSKQVFDLDCKACKRLDDFLCEVKQKYPDYHARPVAPVGDENAQLLIVGLAPGMHGANATGRPFTGDYAGILLYQTLFDFGFSNQKTSESLDDGLLLKNCRITNAVKCLPPQNKPTGPEINQCNHFLAEEIKMLPDNAVIMVLYQSQNIHAVIRV